MRLNRLYRRKIGSKYVSKTVYAARKKDKATVSSVAAFNSDGKLLFGLRNDSRKWTLPGGHAEEGEDPRDAAVRELKEETGLDAGDLEFLGDGYGGRDKNIHVFCYRTTVSGEPTVGQDPDDECSVWSWVDAESEIPGIILDNLHNKKNITLDLLGKLEKKADVNVVDEPHEDMIELSQPSTYPAGEEISQSDSYHSEDSQRVNDSGNGLSRGYTAGGFGNSLSELSGPSMGGASEDLLSDLHNDGENTQEDPDLKLGTVDAPYSSGFGDESVNFEKDNEQNIVVGASLRMRDLIARELDPSLGYQFKSTTSKNGGSVLTKVEVYSTSGDMVGAANFVHQGNVVVPGYIVVEDEHQRRGIASAMCKYVEQQTGKRVSRSNLETDDGVALFNTVAPQPMEQAAVALPDQGVDENKYEDDLSRTDNSISRDPLNEGPVYGR